MYLNSCRTICLKKFFQLKKPNGAVFLIKRVSSTQSSNFEKFRTSPCCTALKLWKYNSDKQNPDLNKRLEKDYHSSRSRSRGNAAAIAAGMAPIAFAGSDPSVSSSDVINDEALGTIPDPPSILPEIDFAMADSVLKNSLSYWGLDTYWPAGLVRQGLDFVHTASGIPWWEAIAFGGVFIRLLSFPLFIYNMKEVERTKPFAEGLAKRQKDLSDALRSGDQMQAQLAQMEFLSYMKTHKVEPWRPMVRMMPNMVIFLSCFLALKKMAAAPIESFKTEGTLWFTDLSVGDPYWFALPMVCAVTMHIVLRTGIESGQSTEAMNPVMKYSLQYGFPLIILIGSSYFSSALLVYWSTSNLMVLFMSLTMKLRIVRKFFNLPIVEKKKAKKMDTRDNPILHPVLFVQNGIKKIKSSWKTYRQPKVPSDAEIDKEDRDKFAKSGKIPVQPTYPFNPKDRLPPKSAKQETAWDRIKSITRKKRSN